MFKLCNTTSRYNILFKIYWNVLQVLSFSDIISVTQDNYFKCLYLSSMNGNQELLIHHLVYVYTYVAITIRIINDKRLVQYFN